MIFSSSDILTPAQLKRLSEHKYSSSGCTLMDPLMQPFWNWLVKKFPLWLAPNLMTITGLIINILTSLVLVFYSPDGTQVAPRWTFLLCAAGLFIYQTLDACDGKQARRTGSSSPLGELFDHGCDSLSTVFVSLGVCIAVQLGGFPSWMFFQCFAAITLFYCAHWQTYVSGTLRFGKFDVTEAQFTIICIHLISAIFGPSVWAIRIPSINIELKFVALFLGLAGVSVAFYSNFTLIFTGGIGKNGSTVALPSLHVELRLLPILVAFTVTLVLCYSYSTVILSGGAGKNGSTVAGTSILSPFIPMGLVVISAFIIYQKSTVNIYENHPCLYILAFGIVASKITNRLVIAHMTKSEIDYLDSALIGPGMLFMNQYFNTFINEYFVLWLCLIYSLADLFHFSAVVCNQICSYLQINLFTIETHTMLEKSSNEKSDYSDNLPLLQQEINDDSSETSVPISDYLSPSYQHPFVEVTVSPSDKPEDELVPK